MDKSFLKEIYEGMKDLAKKLFTNLPVEQSVSMNSIYEQVWNASMSGDDWVWLIDLYMDDSTGNFFAIFSKEGLLYQSKITLNGDIATLGEMVQVSQYFQPTVQNQIVIKRQADSSIRWFLQASSSVLNRNGSIDSTQLYDNMNKKANDSGKYPFLTFCHLDSMEMGMTDWLERSDNILLASGTFHKDNVIAEHMVKSYEENSGYWGASISFFPSDYQMEQIAEGVKVPMYTDGTYREISVCPEEIACCLFTALHAEGKVTQMKKEVEDAIKKLMGTDTALADQIIQAVDGSNDQIKERGLIARTTEAVVETPAEVVPEVVAPAVVAEQPVLEIDEAMLGDIVTRVAKDPQVSAIFSGYQESLHTMSTQLEQTLKEFSEFRVARQVADGKIDSRLHALEKTEQSKQEDWTNDLPRTNSSVRVIRRARVTTDSGEAQSSEDIAADTLSKIK